MAIICPTLNALGELDMFTSDTFKEGGHEIASIRFRNHDKNVLSWVASECEIPKGISTNRGKKKIKKRVYTIHELQFTIDNIDPNGGIEKLQRFLKKEYPGVTFYVAWMLTRTTGRTRHSCYWKLEPASISNSKIKGLHLIKIDNKDVKKHFTEKEMWKIVGKLPDDRCRWETECKSRHVLVCNPIDR
jgi:hypothetical protein